MEITKTYNLTINGIDIELDHEDMLELQERIDVILGNKSTPFHQQVIPIPTPCYQEPFIPTPPFICDDTNTTVIS